MIDTPLMALVREVHQIHTTLVVGLILLSFWIGLSLYDFLRGDR